MMGLLRCVNILSAATDFWSELADTLRNFIWDILGLVLWGFGSIIFVILDIFESIFKAFAGISTDGIKINGKPIDGDPVLYFIQSDVVVQIFISMLILSFILLLMFTVFAVVKNQYAEKQEPVSKIINSAFKGLFMYLLVPVTTVVCLLVGNVILQAINGATTSSQLEIGPSGLLFKACTYNASVLREADLSECRYTLKQNAGVLTRGTWDEINNRVGWTVYTPGGENNIDKVTDRATMDKIAEAIDDVFANEHGGFSWNDKTNWISVSGWYNAADISFITLWVGGIFFIGTISKISWGVASRLFKMVIFYAVSPVIVATYPIDNGGALGKWRSSMVQLGTSAYAAVGITNVMYSILPIISAANVGNDGFANWIARIILSILAFKSADELIKAVSGWFGVGDAYSEGNAAKAKVPKMSAATGAAFGTFMGIKGGLKAADNLEIDKKGFKNKVKRFGLGAMGAFGGSGLAEKTGLDFNKFLGKDGMDKSQKYVEGLATNFGTHAKDRKGIIEEHERKKKVQDKYEAMGGKSGAYEMEKDDGTNEEQLRYREFNINNGTAGQAFYARQSKQQEIDEKAAKENLEMTGYINNYSQNVVRRSKAVAALGNYMKDNGLEGFDFTNDETRNANINKAFAALNEKGIDTSRFGQLVGAFEQFDAAMAEGETALKLRRKTDAKFETFLTKNYKFNNGRLKTGSAEAAAKKLAEAEAAVKAVEEKGETLLKKIAAMNEAQNYGKSYTSIKGLELDMKDLTDADIKKIIEEYAKAHPSDK